MMLYNRDLAMYARNAFRIPAYFVYFIKCFRIFKKPVPFILSYLRMIPPSGGVIELRNGMQIHLSSHPHDVVTVFIIFIRNDYGMVPPRSTVIDIGANIGVFSLFAASCGAAKISAYEPNSEAFRCLERNIHANHLESVIEPHRFAVASSAGRRIRFPKRSSPYNSFLRGESAKEFEFVNTIDLARIMKNIDHVDLLKMDSEGVEWDILNATGRDLLDRIDAFRMEYHLGQRDQIASFLQGNGFSLKYLAGTKDAGTIWLSKPGRNPFFKRR
jgi:FkbM family methyltransferase